MDYFGPPFPLCLRLTGDGPHHGFVNIHALDFHIGDFDSPSICLRVKRLLDVDVEPLPLGEHVVQFVFTQNRTQRGLRQLAGCEKVVLHLDNRLLRVDHAEIHHRVNLDRNVVPGNHVLARHIHDHRAQTHFDHLLDAGNNQHQPRAFYLPKPPEHKHHATIVFAQYAYAGECQQDEHEHKSSKTKTKIKAHIVLLGCYSKWTQKSFRGYCFRLHIEDQPVHANDPNLLSPAQRLPASDAPVFAMNPRPTILAIEVFQHLSDASDQFLAAAHHGSPTCFHCHTGDEEDEQSTGKGNRHDHRPRNSIPQNIGIDQHHRTDHEGNDAADAQHEAGHEHLTGHH